MSHEAELSRLTKYWGLSHLEIEMFQGSIYQKSDITIGVSHIDLLGNKL